MKRIFCLGLLLGACGPDAKLATDIASSSHPIQSVGLESVLAGDTIQLDATTTGCYERRELLLANDTADIVELRGASLDGTSDGAFLQSYLRGGSEFTLQPGESASVLIDIYNEQSGLTAGGVDLGLRVNGASQPQSLNLSLQTQELLPVTDRFVTDGLSKNDLLVAVSRAESMRALGTATRANLITLIGPGSVENLIYDTRVALIAMDSTDGELLTLGTQGAKFAEVTPGLNAAALVDTLDLAPRAGANVRAFDSVLQAVLRGEFRRPGARLSVVFVSDQDDTSPQTLDDFLNRMRVEMGPRFSLSSVVPNNDCGPAALRFLEAANRKHGRFESICNAEWSRAFDGSTINIGFRSRYFLSQPADPTTVTVRMPSGVLNRTNPNGSLSWRYDSAARALTFTPFAVPAPDTPFSVTYIPQCPGLPLP